MSRYSTFLKQLKTLLYPWQAWNREALGFVETVFWLANRHPKLSSAHKRCNAGMEKDNKAFGLLSNHNCAHEYWQESLW